MQLIIDMIIGTAWNQSWIGAEQTELLGQSPADTGR